MLNTVEAEIFIRRGEGCVGRVINANNINGECV